jgi:hypothetical protein
LKNPLSRHIILLTAFLSAAIFLPTMVDCQTFPLALKRLEFRSSFSSDQGNADSAYYLNSPLRVYTSVSRQLGKNPKSFKSLVNKEPNYKMEHPFRQVLAIGGRHFPFVLDSNNLKRKGYNILYFDSNRNGDLTDDGMRKAEANNGSAVGPSMREFARVDITILSKGKDLDYALFICAMALEVPGNPNYTIVSISPAICRTASITLDGRPHRIALLDYNVNGRFDDETSVIKAPGSGRVWASGGDVIIIDPEAMKCSAGNQKVASRSDAYHISKLLRIGEKYFNLKVTRDGASITLSPYEGPMGSVANRNTGYNAVLYGELGIVNISDKHSRAIPIPASNWKLLEYCMDRSAEKETYIMAAGRPACKSICVKKGSTALMRFGPPFKPVVNIVGGRGKTARVSMDLYGSGGEICTALTVDGGRAKSPAFTIVDSEGKIVQRGKFEYG